MRRFAGARRWNTRCAGRRALGLGAIQPAFLPTVRLSTHEVVGFEVIPQRISDDGASIPLQRLIPIAEETGLIQALAEGVLREARIVARTWPAGVRLTANIYPSQSRDELLPARIIRLLRDTGMPPDRLELEITESALVADIECARTTLGALRAPAVRIVLGNSAPATFLPALILRFVRDSGRPTPERHR